MHQLRCKTSCSLPSLQREHKMWFVFALLSSLLWTGISLYDRFTVKAVFSKPTQGLFVAAIFSSVGLVALLFVEWSMPPPEVALMALAAGLFLQVSQYFYFYALDADDVGDVTALGGAYPIFVALATIPLGKFLDVVQWIGVLLVVFSAIALKGVNLKKVSLRGLYYVLGYVVGLTLSNILMSNGMDLIEAGTSTNPHGIDHRFWTAFGPYCIGLVIGGLLPFLLWKKEREALLVAWPAIRPRLIQLGLVEVANVAALGCEVFALSVGHPALVTAAASTEPLFVFLFAHLLSTFPSLPEGCFEPVERIRIKVLLVAMIAIGLGLLAWQ